MRVLRDSQHGGQHGRGQKKDIHDSHCEDSLHCVYVIENAEDDLCAAESFGGDRVVALR